MLALLCIFAPLTAIATILRFVARAQMKVAVGLDDIFALVSLLSFYALMGFGYRSE